MRTVVSNDQVYHLWANEAQSHAHSAHCSFDGPRAYSYRALIGNIVRNKNGEVAYLVSSRRWSPTTNQHQSSLRSAVGYHSGRLVFKGRNIESAEALLLEQMGGIPGKIAAACKGPKGARPEKLGRVSYAVGEARRLASFIAGTDAEVPEETLLTLADYGREIASLIEEYEPFVDEWRSKANERSERAYANFGHGRRWERMQEMFKPFSEEDLAAWLAGERATVPSRIPYERGALLRIKPNTKGKIVQTTLGAEVPASAVRVMAPNLLQLTAEALQTGLPYVFPFGTRIGPFEARGIDADGTLVVGCHHFKVEEIRRFAGVLLLAEEKTNVPVAADGDRSKEAGEVEKSA